MRYLVGQKSENRVGWVGSHIIRFHQRWQKISPNDTLHWPNSICGKWLKIPLLMSNIKFSKCYRGSKRFWRITRILCSTLVFTDWGGWSIKSRITKTAQPLNQFQPQYLSLFEDVHHLIGCRWCLTAKLNTRCCIPEKWTMIALICFPLQNCPEL